MKLFAVVLAFALAGCAASTPPTPAPTASTHIVTAPAEDPNKPEVVKQKFTQKVEQDLATIQPKLLEKIVQGDSQYHAKYAGNYSIDIRQTDSIITPFTGVANYYINWFANGEQTRFQQYIQTNYAYQDGNWVLKSAIRVVVDPDIGRVVNDPSAVGNPAWAKGLFQ